MELERKLFDEKENVIIKENISDLTNFETFN